MDVAVGTDVLVKPVLQWRRGVQETRDPGLRLRRAEPRAGRPLPPRDQALVTEQVNPWMIFGIALRAGLQRVVGGDVEAGLLGLCHDGGQGYAARVVGDGVPVAVKLAGAQHILAAARGQPGGPELNVAAPGNGGAGHRLVPGLVAAETKVSVGAEDLAL